SVDKIKDLETAFDAFARNKAQAVLMYIDPSLCASRIQVRELAPERRLPLMAGQQEFVDVGGLFSYGLNSVDDFRRITAFLDKILKGTKPPGNIPSLTKP